MARVYVDGEHAQDIDLYAENLETEVECFAITDLPRGLHVIQVESMGTKNEKSTGSRIALDAFDVIP
jgi:hypothetical protein